jgi:hypothetical protein
MEMPPGTIKFFSALLKINNLTGPVKFPINVENGIVGIFGLGRTDG